ncbi:MAG: DNA ligase [Desulfotalea sp.]|nr:MAG: DNA ligase [Desulfotalea sp.]
MSMELSKEQSSILQQTGFQFSVLTDGLFLQVAHLEQDVSGLTDDMLIEFLTAANLLYRGGAPCVADDVYDFIFLAELKRRNPGHPFLLEVEPEANVSAKTVLLPERMLSTDKAYGVKDIERWAKRVEKAAKECGVDFTQIQFRATPKLDGYAAYDDGTTFYTRGNGRKGTDISRVFARGLKVAEEGSRGQGPGEIVVKKSYFREHLQTHFENSRNFQASLIKEKELEEPAAKAMDCGAALFYPFRALPSRQGTWAELSPQFDGIVEQLWDEVDFDIDGIVFEITDRQVKDHMGATRHHHRWQIAYKQNTETAEVRVLGVVAQTSRSGRVNPVAEVEPTRLSGALISRATAHHYGMVRDKGIGTGALIKLSRSGEVIPKIEKVLVSVEPTLPDVCPSCGAALVWESDYLICVNVMNCTAQKTHTIEHFFKVLGNVDGFGPSSISKMYAGGVQCLSQIYTLDEEAFVSFGFGPKQAENMVTQLQRSRQESIEDWRFLAAFGIHRMGMGNCEKLLSAYKLEDIFALDRQKIVKIKGFSEKIADEILPGLASVKEVFFALYNLGFNLVRTSVLEETDLLDQGLLSDQLVVFTGTMQGSRDEMKKQAKSLGAKIGSSITGKTTLLVCGEKVGASKLKKAGDLGVKILSESEYLQLIGE